MLDSIGEERMNPSEIMTIEEYTKYLKTSFSTLYKLAQEGKIPAFKLSGQYIIPRLLNFVSLFETIEIFLSYNYMIDKI